jgi:ATP adenylyltransferase/5',5'''-P-1,P-4-tetraphosphate phosphorylase II
VNALGFVGGVLVRDEEQFNLLKKVGPMTALQHVAMSLNSA